MSKLTIWVVSDGRSGIETQALGLAEAVARLRDAEIVIKRVAYRGALGRLPSLLNLFPRRALAEGSDPIEPPWPDLWIGTGRASLALSIGVRRWSARKTFVVQAQDPRLPAGLFDLLVPPKHDRVHGDNVFSLTGAPNRLTPERLASDRARFAPLIDPLPQPRAAVLIGGRSRAFDLTPARAKTLARELDLALDQEGAALLMTFSRRTPDDAKEILTARLGRRPGVIWDGVGENPYYAFLAAADFIAVTEDSTNMATEAAGTGAPVFILKMDGQSFRMRRFHEDLEARGAARPFGGAFYRWAYDPLRETDRAAAEIVRRIDLRGAPPSQPSALSSRP
jgi:mitochondrial fission protein ELM1